MKRLYILLTLFCLALAPAPLFAQKKGEGGKSHKEMRKEMEDFKMKFFAQKMELQGETKEKFFEVFREYAKDMGDGFIQRRRAEKKLKGIAAPTDADYAEAQKEQKAGRDKENAAEAKFEEDCSKFLSPKQMIKLQEAREEFRQKMIELKAKKCAKEKK